MTYLEINEVVLVHCNIINYEYQHDSMVSYTFILNKPSAQSLDISRKIFFF